MYYLHWSICDLVMMHHIRSICCNTSTIIDTWSCHMMHHLRSMCYLVTCCITSYDASPTNDVWSCQMMHYLRSMCDHNMWCVIAYDRYVIMSYDASPTFDASIDGSVCHYGLWCIFTYNVSMDGSIYDLVTVYMIWWQFNCNLLWIIFYIYLSFL